MLHFNRIDVSEGTDIDKTCVSKESHICHYWHFLDKGFKFQFIDACNGSCYLPMMSMNLAILLF